MVGTYNAGRSVHLRHLHLVDVEGFLLVAVGDKVLQFSGQEDQQKSMHGGVCARVVFYVLLPFSLRT